MVRDLGMGIPYPQHVRREICLAEMLRAEGLGTEAQAIYVIIMALHAKSQMECMSFVT